MNISYTKHTKSYIPYYGSLIDNEVISNYKKDRKKFLNSIESNSNKGLSLLPYNEFKHNYNTSSIKLNTESSDINLNFNKRRSRNACHCCCHSKENSLNLPEYQCEYYFYKNPYRSQCSNINSFGINKISNNLENKINNLKKNLKNFENKLNKTKIDKTASDFYIKKLEKELSDINVNDSFDKIIINKNDKNLNRIKNYNNNNYIKNPNKLSKSLLVADPFMDKINESKIKIKVKEDYSFNKNKDYNNIIQKQKDWLDTLHQNHDNINNFNNLGNYNNNKFNKFNNFNSYNYLNNKYNINNSQSLNKSDSIPKYDIKAYSDNNYKNNLNYNNNKESYDKNNRINNISYPVVSNIKKERVYEHIPYKNSIKKQMVNTNFNKFIYKPELHISNNKNQNELINQIRQNQINDNIYKNNIIKNNKNIKDNYILNTINERYLIINNGGTPIYQKGKRILGMKLIKNKENKKDNLNNKNENIIFLGPDGQYRSIEELKPIILDNNIPLVNEDNKPFLGINNIFLIDEKGNSITGWTEMINEKKQVVQGELGILPRDKYGNILKIKLLNDNDKGNKKNKNNNLNKIGIDINIDNNNIINNKKIKKKINNSVDIKNNNKKRYFPELIKTKINLTNISQLNNKNKNKKFYKNKLIENNKNSKEEFLYSSCFACDVGCGVSRTGYSSMTYSPFNKRLKRKEETPLKNGTKYEQYYKYKNQL